MSEQTKSRFEVDLDDLERQLRQTASAQPRAQSNDPLAELARIVGQDDPFKAMFTDKRAGTPPANEPTPAPARVEPRLDLLMRDHHAPVQAAMPEELSPPLQSTAGPPSDMLDEFDRLLRSEMRGSIVDVRSVSSQPYAFQPKDLPAEDAQPSPPQPYAPSRYAAQRVDAGAQANPHREQEPLPLDDLDELAREIHEDERLPAHGGDSDAADYPEPPAEPVADMRSLEAQQPRKGLLISSALLGVAALGIGAVIGIRSLAGPSVRSGEPPTIKAEAGPNKVAPINPGGVDIPNQNKQIYERTPEPKSADTKIVTREEQPMDVQATTRAARVILLGPGAGPADPAAPPAASLAPVAPGAAPAAAPQIAGIPAAPALGEPRRVRTVAVRPDGTIAPINGASINGVPVAPAKAAPAPSATTASAASTPRQPVASPPSTAAQPPAPRPPARPAAEPQAPRTPPGRVQTAAAPVAPPAAPSAAAAPASGGFMIQLGAPGSEAEARASFASLQRRFGDQLASASPSIRRAELGNGRTVWRLRIGPYSREDAAEKCQSLQAAGGQCFIARN